MAQTYMLTAFRFGDGLRKVRCCAATIIGPVSRVFDERLGRPQQLLRVPMEVAELDNVGLNPSSLV
jgi:hypothetical protein